MQKSRVRQTQKAATRAAILDGSKRLFVERGYFGTSIEDIVIESGVGTRGALYHHFSSKKDLFEAVFSEVGSEFMAVSDALIDDRGDPLDRLRDGILGFLAAAAENAAIRQIILIDGPAVFGAERWRSLQTRRGFDSMSAGVERAIDQGSIARQPVPALAQLLIALLDEAAVIIATSADPVAARDEVSTALKSLINGLRIR